MLRKAQLKDIEGMHYVRMSVVENRLLNPDLVPKTAYLPFVKGDAVVWEERGCIVGFAAVDRKMGSVWALFVHPEYERKGIGQALLLEVVSGFFDGTRNLLWLTTDPGTRAEHFYRAAGWHQVGTADNGELRFELYG
jgi:GNAT superfamily N-acetyltransferase